MASPPILIDQIPRQLATVNWIQGLFSPAIGVCWATGQDLFPRNPSRSRAGHIFVSRPGTRTGRFLSDILYREFRSHHKLAPPAVIAAIQPFVAQPASEK